MSTLSASLALLSALIVPHPLALLPGEAKASLLGDRARPLAMQSPWWENYETKDRFLCDRRISVVLERNESQASLISGGSRMILFRESSEAPGVRYRNDQMLIILRGDELTLERLPDRLSCVRTEQV